MNGRFLLDTSIIIALFANEPEVRNRISGSEEVFISSVSLGELYFGAYRSSKAQENIDRIDDFALSTTVLNCSVPISTPACGTTLLIVLLLPSFP
jgi:tRNA(fMet)-specific endonuclease VapC